MSKSKQMSDVTVRQAKPKEKDYIMYDADGLFVIIKTTGKKWWRFRYTFQGKQKTLSLGTYPNTTLAAAREMARKFKAMLLEGRNPASVRKGEARSQANTFEAIAREWFATNEPNWKASHSKTVIRRLERDVFPWLGNRPVSEIGAQEVLRVLRRQEERGHFETAKREKQIVSQVFRYAGALELCPADPTYCLDGLLTPPPERHYPAITEERELGQLLADAWGWRGGAIVRAALRFSFYSMLRPGEVRHIEWGWINTENRLLVMPEGSMKDNDRSHLVPLTKQMVDLLEELRPLTGKSRYVFPSGWGGNLGKPLSEAGCLQALRRMGYTKEQTCVHSLRTSASTLLNESQRWNPDAIEIQLHHKIGNKIRRIYNRAEYLPERRDIMQWLGDKLDQLRLKAEGQSVEQVVS